MFAALACLAVPCAAHAQGELSGLRNAAATEASQQLFFDAASTSFTKDGTQQTFDGDFVAIGGGTIFAADHVSVDRTRGILEASGHVVVMSQNTVFTGERVRYLLDSGDFTIEQASMAVNDAVKTEEITRQILGLSAKEVEFEAKRRLRLAEIGDRKARLRNEARRQAQPPSVLPAEAPPPEVDEGLVERYAQLLDQEILTTKQPNPSLTRIPAERRGTLLKHREFYEKSRAARGGLGAKAAPEALYFKVTGDQISRTDGNDFRAKESLFTPCLCKDDEVPAWGFRSAAMFAQIGGYADLSHPVLEIKGIPVLYLPYLKIPLKSERQTGFLPPVFAFEARSGTIYSQPVFFDLGKDSDATLTTDVFENRGTRLGLEYRTQQRELAGWEFNIEGIRDHLWLEERSRRQQALPLLDAGIDCAVADPVKPGCTRAKGTAEDAGFWKASQLGYTLGTQAEADAAKRDLAERLGVPGNTWRGAYQWRGNTYLAPRLSIVSNAEVLSDHRYAEELRVPNDFQEALFGGRSSRTYQDAKAQLNLDGKDLYAGVGIRFGDNNGLSERYAGQQTPLRLTLMPRTISLLPPSAAVPVYAQASVEQIRIAAFGRADPNAAPGTTLGDGYWRRLRVNTIAPLVSDAIVQVEQFTESDARFIEHQGLGEPSSQMRSFRTGVDFVLPIDGKRELPDWLESANPICVLGSGQYSESGCERLKSDPNQPAKWLHHLMDWRLRFSVRPSVVKRGPYAEPDQDRRRLAYFSSDVPAPRGDDALQDPDVPDELRMKPHQIVELSTTQVWRLFTRSWNLKKAEALPPQGPDAASSPAPSAPTPTAPETLEERARRELLLSLDRPLTPDAALLDRTNNRWLIDRYALEDQYYDTPATFHASVAYDAIDARDRAAIKRRNGEVENSAAIPDGWKPEMLPEGWKDVNTDLSLAHAGFTATAAAKYGIYVHDLREESFTLGLPSMVRSNLSLGYSRRKDFAAKLEDPRVTRDRSLSLDTSLIPSVITYIRLTKRMIDQETDASYTKRFHTSLGFTLTTDAKCWGLNFARDKDFEKDEGDATYVLQLFVVFMGLQRPLPRMDKGIVRDVRSQQ